MAIRDAKTLGGPAARPRRSACEPLAGRLGLSVPHEWWQSPPLLKSYEAAGFAWVQLHAPPVAVLTEPRRCIRHAAAARASLATTGLRAFVHAPSDLRAGRRGGDRGFEGLLSYAAEAGAAQVVYHAMALPESPATESALAAEARSLTALASLVERLGVTIALENLAPLYPGPETLSANPLSPSRPRPEDRLRTSGALPRSTSDTPSSRSTRRTGRVPTSSRPVPPGCCPPACRPALVAGAR